ncbi:PqqD family protein [Sphingomicrobium sediminis]|uniref:PqqD family protein n=1 Tax=Sphingomicrobium sediminis TaxID=2950949 RepID=A0A9X2EN96_9SPHN|nr:PqqD family protein [Sphingomicrobium sediminis]MCM8558317.1 PqqD family protein [Sphingomicrobium sediminis]
MQKANPSLSLDDRVARNAAIPTGEVDHELMALDPKAGEVYGLDAIGTEIWKSIEGETRIGDIVDRMLDEFDVDRATCEADTLSFLDELLAANMILKVDA